jgi:hypothetical protein
MMEPTLAEILEENMLFYIKHTMPNDAGIDEIINSSERLGTFEQVHPNSWVFRGLASVGHILKTTDQDDHLMCYANFPYQAFTSLEDAQKRMLALDVLLAKKITNRINATGSS